MITNRTSYPFISDIQRLSIDIQGFDVVYLVLLTLKTESK